MVEKQLCTLDPIKEAIYVIVYIHTSMEKMFLALIISYLIGLYQYNFTTKHSVNLSYIIVKYFKYMGSYNISRKYDLIKAVTQKLFMIQANIVISNCVFVSTCIYEYAA